MNNEKYNAMKAKHPEWSDEQIWTAISLDMEATAVIEKKGDDINPNDPDIFTTIIEGAKKWLELVLPIIFARVKPFFDKLLDNLAVWIKKGWDYVSVLISKWIVV